MSTRVAVAGVTSFRGRCEEEGQGAASGRAECHNRPSMCYTVRLLVWRMDDDDDGILFGISL